jgi:hypothetical protein
MAMNWPEGDAGFMTSVQQIKQEVYMNNLSVFQELTFWHQNLAFKF